MSSLLDLHLDEVEDPQVVPEGEYELKITSAKIKESPKTGRTYIGISFGIQDNPMAKSVFNNYSFPMKDDPDNTVYMLKRQLKDFCLAFDLDPANPGEPDEWKGQTGWVVLKTQQNSETGEDENVIGRYLIQK